MSTTVYVTFGVKYACEPHALPWVHPGGFLVIVAEDYETARGVAFALTGGDFALCYPEPPGAAHYPRGELARLECIAGQWVLTVHAEADSEAPAPANAGATS